MTGKKPFTLVRAALMNNEYVFASAVTRSRRPFVKIPDSPIHTPVTERSHRYYAWATGESGEAPYLLYAGQPRKDYRSHVGGNNVIVVATAWEPALSEGLIAEFAEQTGILLGNHLPENVVRMHVASMGAGFCRFVADPAEFLQIRGLPSNRQKI
ncbi:MAG: hypothetical protein AABX53_01105 [Nanoarchaeota archaeon]